MGSNCTKALGATSPVPLTEGGQTGNNEPSRQMRAPTSGNLLFI